MSALLYLFGVVFFVLAILASIGLHELGHMIPAKHFGGKVTQYFIGFGPTVWSRQRGETEYGIKAVPLGGYVKIVGMLPPTVDGVADEVTYDEQGNKVVKVRKSNTGLFTQLISDARAAEWELVQPGDANRLFYKLPWWQKVVVMSGGPTVNLVIAFCLFWGVFATYGDRHVEANAGAPVVESVSQCLLPYTEEGRPCRPDDPPTPAVEAGLAPGDVIVSFNGSDVTGWDQFKSMIQANRSGRAVIGFERDGQPMTGTTSTSVQLRPTSDTDLTLHEVGFLGVTAESHEVITTGGPLYTLGQMGMMTGRTMHALVHLPVNVWGVAKAIVGVEDRSLDSPVSIVGGGRIAGETASHDEFPLAEKIVFLLMLVAGFNLFIGLFNFLPLLPLDGGHIAGALWEAGRRGLARMSGRPDPGYVDVAKLLPVAYAVGVVLLVMGVVLIVGDLVVPIHIEG